MTESDIKLIEEAKNGNPVAQTELGKLYYDGVNRKQSFIKAVYWYKEAIENRYAPAMLYFGICLLHGEGIARNPGIAYDFFEMAIKHRSRVAEFKKHTIVIKKKENNKIELRYLRKEENEKSRNYTQILERKPAMPQEAKNKLDEKIDESSKGSKGKQLKRNELIKAFPWGASNANSIAGVDLHTIKQAMDKQLYGLETVKRQVMRYLAICKRNPSVQIRPLLLYGPPGTGKSSFGRIISNVIKKPLKVISMPSITAGFEFTGHEKFWESAGCGIIIQSIIDAGEYPVFLIDEIDKAGFLSGRHSSPQHGLLNLLDDNRDKFTDVFFEVPINLQNALFILTANNIDYVDKFILDRCKIIAVEGYKDIGDRRIILNNYILPKLYKQYNLTHDDYKLPEPVIEMILAESVDPEGGLRILQTQAESVLQEVMLRMETDKQDNSDAGDILTQEEVQEVLNEISANNSDTTGCVMGFV